MNDRIPARWRLIDAQGPRAGVRVAMILLAALLYPLVVLGAWKAWDNSHTRVLDWLPEKFEETQELFEFVSRFGANEMMVIGWETAKLDDERVQQLVKRLRSGDPQSDATDAYFDQVWSGPDIYAVLTGPPLNQNSCELAQIVLDPDLPVIEVFPRDRVLSHQEAAPGGAIKKMADRHFVGIKHFALSQTSHHTPHKGKSSRAGKS